MASDTVGTLASGTDFVGLNEVMKVYYQDPVWENVVSESELLDLFDRENAVEVYDSLGGRWTELAHSMADAGGSGARKEGGYIPQAGAPTFKNGKIFLKKNYMTVQMSSDAMRKVKQGPYAFLSWIDKALVNAVRRHRHHIDRQALGTGTGIVARVNAAVPATDLVLDSAFGITGRSKPTFLLQINDQVRTGPNADGSALRANAATITGIDHNTNTITIDALPTSTADNDYVFLGDSADNGSRKGGAASGEDDSEMMGLFGIVDSATTNVLTSFQNLTRASTPHWYGFSLDASQAPYSGDLSEDAFTKLIDDIIDQGMGTPGVVACSRAARRNYFKTLRGERRQTDPRQLVGGLGAPTIQLDGKDFQLKVVRKMPDEVAMVLDKRSLKRWQYGAGFEWDDTTGAIWRQVSDATGVKDAFYAYGRLEGQLGCIAPAWNGIITGITAG